jgi:hypothetical protein
MTLAEPNHRYKAMPKPCSEEGCGAIARVRGFCSIHYSRQRCCVEGCKNRLWLYGRCKRCFEGLDPWMYQQLKDVPQDERQRTFERLSRPPDRPKWEYPGDEDALADQYGKNDELKLESTETK